MECTSCKKIFASSTTLRNHVNNYCHVLREAMKQKCAELKLKVEDLEVEIKILKKISLEKDTQIESLAKTTQDKDELILSLKEKLIRAETGKEIARKDGELETTRTFMQETKEHAEKLENHILRENSKPRNNITINLSPYDFSPESIQAVCAQYTAEDFLKGPEATYKFILEKHMKDNGRPRIKCTDPSRKVFRGVKTDGTEYTDVGGRKLVTAVAAPMKRAVKNAGGSIETLTDEEYCKKVSSHHRVLEPSRLTKRFAVDLNT